MPTLAPARPAAPLAELAWLSLPEAARYIRCSERHLWSLLAPRGPIPCAKSGKRVLVAREALDRYLASVTQQPVA